MKNNYILVVNFFVAFCFLLTVSRASLFCTITQESCVGSKDFPGTLVLRISDLTNAHAELPRENNYPIEFHILRCIRSSSTVGLGIKILEADGLCLLQYIEQMSWPAVS
ncbi:MAG: hypothetical protein RMH75_07320 [Archaeoglobaceae archaeon]|nr:hypothetical protein [Archaeoglobaceae archaeon]